MRKGFTVFAALVAASLVATPFVVGTTRALAVSGGSESVAQAVTVAPVEVAPVAVGPSAAAPTETCGRKVRVVYSGYAVPAGCAAR